MIRNAGGTASTCRKFVLKLHEYVREETLKHEIAGIETLVTLMTPEDITTISREGLRPRPDSPVSGGISTGTFHKMSQNLQYPAYFDKMTVRSHKPDKEQPESGPGHRSFCIRGIGKSQAV